VSPRRRSIGLLIAVGLLALLVVGATYFAVKVTRGATDTTSTGASTAAPRP
jgi:hypothetical protein